MFGARIEASPAANRSIGLVGKARQPSSSRQRERIVVAERRCGVDAQSRPVPDFCAASRARATSAASARVERQPRLRLGESRQIVEWLPARNG
jgi:hypothetical protein